MAYTLSWTMHWKVHPNWRSYSCKPLQSAWTRAEPGCPRGWARPLLWFINSARAIRDWAAVISAASRCTKMNGFRRLDRPSGSFIVQWRLVMQLPRSGVTRADSGNTQVRRTCAWTSQRSRFASRISLVQRAHSRYEEDNWRSLLGTTSVTAAVC